MKRLMLIVLAVVAFAVPNAFPQASNSGDQTAKAKDDKPPKQAPGIRKLSRRERKDRIKNLGEKYRQFLTDVEPIMQPSELDTFLLLETDAQRDIYMVEFWRRRDVAQGTTNHAFQDEYYARLDLVKQEFKNASSDRGRIMLIHGFPNDRIKVNCPRYLVPIEIWKYAYIPNLGHDVRFLFFTMRNGFDFQLWDPNFPDAITQLVSTDAAVGLGNEAGGANYVFGRVNPYTSMTNVEMDCQFGDELMKAIYQSQINKTQLARIFEPPEVNEEDVHKILRSVVLADPAAAKLPAEFSVKFPAKQGGRTDAEMTIFIPRSQVTLKEVNGTKIYSLDVTGEVLKEDQLFENYRYRFDYPADVSGEKLAIVIDRFLRPADYKARIRVRDANSNTEAILEQLITVPELFDSPEQQKQKEAASTTVAKLKDDIESDTTRLRIVPLPDDLLHGVQHIETIATGTDISAVEFYLDGKKVMTKRQPPYTLDLDFGEVPQVRRIRAVALNMKGDPITGDEINVNTGNDPFRVRIVSPRVAFKLQGRTRVEMSVAIPDGKKLDHVELYLNQTKVATLFGPPYVQTIDVPAAQGVGFLRAVAMLKDDAVTPPVEDLVMINSPQFMEEVNVHLVELPTTVIRNGRPVNDLAENAFKVLDEGKPAKVAKFEHVTNLPLSIGLAIDTSGSMQPRMSEAQKAASNFFSNVMRTGDRAFLVSFDTQPQLVQRWSSKLSDVNAGLAKLRAEEATSLYDAIVYSLYNFLGIKGQKALIVITDGKDTASKFTYDQALEYARRATVPIYAIAIGVGGTEVDTRFKLGRFCSETGGNVYYIQQAADLARVYDQIQTELRSQYILGIYPPDGVKPGSKWREVTVQVGDGKAKTIRGYYP